MISLLAVTLMAHFYLHPHERIVFYGDSITEQRLYSTYVEAFVATRYPNLDVQFFNRGWAGDTSWGGGGGAPDERIKRDVTPMKPTLIFVMLGMNDGGYVPYEPKIEQTITEWFAKDLDQMIRENPSVRLTVAATSPWDDWAHKYEYSGKPPDPWAPWNGYNDVLRRYMAIYKAEVSKRKGQFVDFNTPLSAVLAEAAKESPATAANIIPDGIHPGPAGHLVMAGELLKSWGVDPVVSDVTINGATSKVVETKKSTITALKGWTWSQLDESLPFVVDPSDELLQKVAALYRFDEALNRESLRVTDLPGGAYDLQIDGVKVATFSNTQLADGINLAGVDTAMRRQAQSVMDLCRRKSDIEFDAWRHVERENGDLRASQAAYKSLEALAEELRKEMLIAARPRTHSFALVRHPGLH